jgi:signal peptidase I
MEEELFEKKENGEEKEEESSLNKAKRNLKEAISWLVTLIIVVIASYVITNFIILKAEIPTGSMEKTIMPNDKVIGWRLFTNIKRGDIVIFPALKYSGEDCLYVKRVIGLPGETVEVHDGAVYINGEKLEEDYLPEVIARDSGPYEVPEGCYFLLGDNRNYSGDAREWTINKYVSKKDIKAKVLFKYYPSLDWIEAPEY